MGKVRPSRRVRQATCRGEERREGEKRASTSSLSVAALDRGALLSADTPHGTGERQPPARGLAYPRAWPRPTPGCTRGERAAARAAVAPRQSVAGGVEASEAAHLVDEAADDGIPAGGAAKRESAVGRSKASPKTSAERGVSLWRRPRGACLPSSVRQPASLPRPRDCWPPTSKSARTPLPTGRRSRPAAAMDSAQTRVARRMVRGAQPQPLTTD